MATMSGDRSLLKWGIIGGLGALAGLTAVGALSSNAPALEMARPRVQARATALVDSPDSSSKPPKDPDPKCDEIYRGFLNYARMHLDDPNTRFLVGIFTRVYGFGPANTFEKMFQVPQEGYSEGLNTLIDNLNWVCPKKND
jgi:hypothetical protein